MINNKEEKGLIGKLKYKRDMLERYRIDIEGMSEDVHVSKVEYFITRLVTLESQYVDAWFELSAIADNTSGLDTPVTFSKICDELQLTARAFLNTQLTVPSFKRRQLVLVSSDNVRACPLCKGAHNLPRCNRFALLSPNERANEARRIKVCFNCLCHPASVPCKSRFKCTECNRKHHTLLHFPRTDTRASANAAEASSVAPVLQDVSACCAEHCLADETNKKNWEIDNALPLELNSLPSAEQQFCEKHFKETASQDSTGRFVVSMPFTSDLSQLGSSYNIALQRSIKLENRLTVDSEISKLFDPMGLISPIIIIGKLIVQDIWKLKLSWNEALSMSICSEWTSLIECLSRVPLLSIPRFVLETAALRIEIHGFCGASTRAYGACLYVRACYATHITVNLLCSKRRVAPLKPVTLPRLELLAAVLLSEVYNKVSKTLNLQKYRTYFWSDSTVTLYWIHSDPSCYKTFVANRIAVIQEQTSNHSWHHCISQENPTDPISRGCSLIDRSISAFWFHGPNFLKNSSFVPVTFKPERLESLPEQKGLQLPSLVICEENHLYTADRFSKFSKLERIFAYIRRFAENSRTEPNKRQRGAFTVSEILRSTEDIVYVCQTVAFSTELKYLKSDRPLLKKSAHFISLSPLLDSRGLIRVGGRLRNASISYSQAHPLLLPKNNHLTTLIAEHYHIRNFHCGPNHLLALLRESFWPIAGRNLCRKIVHNCVTCIRVRPKLLSERMADLPSSRVTQEFACFYNTGIDFAGPILLKDRQTRQSQLIKAYIALFVCMTSRAIHLELITSLSTADFIETLKRFIARRGMPRHMYSDNATNFTGAARELKELYEAPRAAQLQQFVLNEGITWHFNPPSAPHHGGIWESNIKSAKISLLKVLGGANLTFERMYTVLVQVEALLNSRPLSPLSSDPADFAP